MYVGQPPSRRLSARPAVVPPTTPTTSGWPTRPGQRQEPTLAVERKILRRSYHTLRELGDAALAMPVPEDKGVAA